MFMLFALSTFSSAAPVPSFDDWLSHMHKSYINSSEYDYREHVFYRNINYINRHNEKQSSYKLGVNKFTDRTFEEFSKTVLMKPKTFSPTNPIKAADLHYVNWRENGLVQEVNDQKDCGSCWAFSAAEALSGAYARQYNTNAPVLSPQELVDCVPSQYADGCNGGWPNDTIAFSLRALGGLERWRDYPYVGYDQACNKTNVNNTLQINGTMQMVIPGNQTSLLEALYKYGPISICFDVEESFMSYSYGLYSSTECSLESVDHAMLLYALQYDPVAKKWAYVIRNSWGADVKDSSYGFGVDGDVYVDAEISDGNICAITMVSSYVNY